MAAFIVMMALHYQIIVKPVFRPSLELIRGHEAVSVVEIPRNGELQPDGMMVSGRVRW